MISYCLNACRKDLVTNTDHERDSITLVVDGMLKSRSGAT